MNTAPNAPTQGGNPSWDLICVADLLDDIRRDHAFLSTLYAIARDNTSLMDADLYHLLTAYQETNPRERLQSASDQIMTVARSLRDRRQDNNL
jgi:hypothetical protein